jgi:molecular chaperone GrpE (heat shock protein)
MTLKKLTCLGLIVLLAGSSLLACLLWQEEARLDRVTLWYGGIFRTSNSERNGHRGQMPYSSQENFDKILEELQAQSEEDRAKGQEKRLHANLERLVLSPPDDPLLAQALYGKGWEEEVSHYREQKAQQELIFTASMVLTGSGGLVFLCCSLVGLLRLSRRNISSVFRHAPTADEPDTTDSNAPVRTVSNQTPPPSVEPTGRRPKLGAESGHAQVPAKVPIELPGIRMSRNRIDQDSPTYRRDQPVFNEYCLNDLTGADVRLKNLFADEPLSLPVTSGSTRQADTVEPPPPQENSVEENVSGAPSEVSTPLTELLQSKTAKVEQRLNEFKEMAQESPGPGKAQSEPMNEALQEMSTQISAIRDYAASQQDRVEKLQNGYDWTIIRQFGLRIIRCVDNLEQRIDKQGLESPAAEQLTEIHDELLFALESSGVEQFVPELHSSYRGQERTAEAVKEKEPCAGGELAGKIAGIIKPGYQYVIDEENVKVVRTARVKLYG